MLKEKSSADVVYEDPDQELGLLVSNMYTIICLVYMNIAVRHVGSLNKFSSAGYNLALVLKWNQAPSSNRKVVRIKGSLFDLYD